MMKIIPGGQLEVSVLVSSEVVTVKVQDRRSDSITLFKELTADHCRELAIDAWSIGLRALANARAQAQEARLHDVGATLLADLDRQLRLHVENQQQTITAVLSKFFDPQDGQVTQRLAAFVDDQGVLNRLLEKYFAPQHGVLAQELAHQIGENSPLFKKFSPTESQGLVKILESQLRAVMHEGHSELIQALDPLSEDGAVARFLRSLRDELKDADTDRAKQLSTALTALNANDESSLINRLVRETHRARQELLQAVNPDIPESPMAIIASTLTTLLREQASTQTELLRMQHTRQEQFEKEVREALARIDTRRGHDQKSVQGGLQFEDAVVRFVEAATRGAPCVFDVTGNTAGIGGRCKKGDAVLRFTSETAFDGAKIVFEAKRDRTYTTEKALNELDTARKNRDAIAGIFVMAASHVSDGFPRFSRCGNNVLVTWDDEDPATNPYLHAAILLGMALVSRSKTVGDPGDIAALRDLESRIENELTRLDKLEKYNDSIRKNSDNIAEEVRKAKKILDVLVRNAQSTLRALNIDSQDEGLERASPITLPLDSLEQGSAALSQSKDAA